MDKHASSDKIITINLVDEGTFLSGRSIAQDFVENLKVVSLDNYQVNLNFEGVESCSQSFLSEIVVRLKAKGLLPGKVKFYSIQDEVVLKRLQTELKRLGMI